MKLINIIFFVIIFSQFLFTSEYVNYGGEIFKVSGDARISSMGGSNPVLFGSAGQLIHNPASIRVNNSKFISFTMQNHFSGLIKSNIFTTYIKHNNSYNISLAIINRSIDNIPYTNNAFILNGDIVTPINYNNISYFNHTELASVISLATNIKNHYFGVNFKNVLYSIYRENAIGIGLDIGYLFNKTNYFIGINLKNFPLTEIKWSTDYSEKIISSFQIGMGYKSNFMFLTTSIENKINIIKYDNRYLTYNVGFEYYINDIFNLRGGINNNSSITLGFGIKKSIINIDYAYISNNSNLPFNSSHCITLGINLNK